jgi:hypothetical protein
MLQVACRGSEVHEQTRAPSIYGEQKLEILREADHSLGRR